MAGDFRFGLANGAHLITRVALPTRVTAMITGRVAMMDVAAADSRWRSFPLRGPLPFSGANAALGYLPLQLALRPEIRLLMIRQAILRGYLVSPSFSISASGCGSWPRKLRYRTAAPWLSPFSRMFLRKEFETSLLKNPFCHIEITEVQLTHLGTPRL